MVEGSNILQLHYVFVDESHSIDSLLRNECEKELLFFFKDISEALGVSIHLESEPTEEGGFKETWKFLGKNAAQITLIISVITIVISRYPAQNETLTALQIENLKLDNDIKRKELEKLKLDSIQNNEDVTDKKILDSVEFVQNGYKTTWRKSNFFRKIQSYRKIDSIELQRFKDDEPIGLPRKIPRNSFQKFILKSDDLPDLQLDNATIDVIAPAIKQGKFKWKGFYNKEIITFEMAHNEFKRQVMKGEVHFSNTFSIEVNMTQSRKIDQDGNIKVIGTVIHKVLATIENGVKSDFTIDK